MHDQDPYSKRHLSRRFSSFVAVHTCDQHNSKNRLHLMLCIVMRRNNKQEHTQNTTVYIFFWHPPLTFVLDVEATSTQPVSSDTMRAYFSHHLWFEPLQTRNTSSAIHRLVHKTSCWPLSQKGSKYWIRQSNNRLKVSRTLLI